MKQTPLIPLQSKSPTPLSKLNTKTRRRRRRSQSQRLPPPLDVTITRQEAHLQRNRVAAAKSRVKKTSEACVLEENATKRSLIKSKLKKEFEVVLEEVVSLRQRVEELPYTHASIACTVGPSASEHSSSVRRVENASKFMLTDKYFYKSVRLL